VVDRAGRLLRPTSAYLGAVVAAGTAARLAGADPGLVALASWLSAIALWFLAVYLVATALVPLLVPAVRRAGLLVAVGLAAVVAAGDAVRLTTGEPWHGAAGYLAGWLVPFVLGIAWRLGRLPVDPRRAGLLAVAGLGTALLLVAAGPYPVSVVAVPGEPVQNTDPPTAALVAFGVGQLGLVLALRGLLEPLLHRARVWQVVVAVNAVVMTVYLWHMGALVLGAGLLVAPGLLDVPEVGSGAWWLSRVPWVAALAGLLAVLVVALSPLERAGGARGSGGARAAPGVPRVAAGVALTATGIVAVSVAGFTADTPLGLPLPQLAPYVVGVLLLRRPSAHHHVSSVRASMSRT